MFTRQLSLPINQSFFVFGARSTGKSTLLRQRFSSETSLWIDLLEPVQEDRLSRHPEDLLALVAALPETVTHVVIDEVQKVPKLLDVVHLLIEKHPNVL